MYHHALGISFLSFLFFVLFYFEFLLRVKDLTDDLFSFDHSLKRIPLLVLKEHLGWESDSVGKEVLAGKHNYLNATHSMQMVERKPASLS